MSDVISPFGPPLDPSAKKAAKTSDFDATQDARADVRPAEPSVAEKSAKAIALAMRLAGMFAGPVVADAASAPQTSITHVVTPEAPASLTLQVVAHTVLDPSRAEPMAQVMVVVVHDSPETKEETVGVLHKAFKELSSSTGEIAKEVLKTGLKWTDQLVLAAIAAWFMKQDSKRAQWLGDVIAKIARLLNDKVKEPTTVTEDEIAVACDLTKEQATAVLTYLGYPRSAVSPSVNIPRIPMIRL